MSENTNGEVPNANPSTPMDPETLKVYQAAEIIQNALSMRRDLFTRLLDPRRNIYDECGFPQTEQLSAWDYQRLFERDPIARRLVELMPKYCFQTHPEVYEDEDPEVETPFEESTEHVGDFVAKGVGNWNKQKEGNIVYNYLKLLYIQARISRYAVLLYGFDDVSPSSGNNGLLQPVQRKQGRKLLYLRVFPETLAPITRWDSNPASPRYGMPEEYTLTVGDPLVRDDQQTGGEGYYGPGQRTMRVHYSRVLHFAPNMTPNEWIGEPECQSVLNNLLSLQKLYGASPEGYWKMCFTGLSFESVGNEPMQMNSREMKNLIENWQNGLQRAFALVGFSAKTIAPTVVDPTPHIKTQLEAISIAKNIPMRIFMGSERGELASSQDAGDWNDKVKEVQNTDLLPRLIIPFWNTLIWAGVCPEPGEDGFRAEWPETDSQTKAEKATVAKTMTDTLATYVQSGSDALIPPADFLTRFLSFTQDEAESILDSAEEHQQETLDKQIEKQKTMIEEGVLPDPSGRKNSQDQQEQDGQQEGNGNQTPPPGNGKPKTPPPIPPKTTPTGNLALDMNRELNWEAEFGWKRDIGGEG